MLKIKLRMGEALGLLFWMGPGKMGLHRLTVAALKKVLRVLRPEEKAHGLEHALKVAEASMEYLERTSWQGLGARARKVRLTALAYLIGLLHDLIRLPEVEGKSAELTAEFIKTGQIPPGIKRENA